MPESRSVTGATVEKAESTPPKSPYVGLSFYREADAALFFGREPERQLIMSNLRASRLTLLYAESGVGKSSLLRAGVAARLDELARDRFERGGAVSVPMVFSNWKDDPVENLIDVIEQAINSYIDGRHEKLPRKSLNEAIEAAIAALDRAGALAQTGGNGSSDEDARRSNLLIILDQFEEYFHSSREPTPGRLAEELSECLNRADLRANFLISIREDAYSMLGDLLKGRMSNVYGNYLHLEYLDARGAKAAIEEPILRYKKQHGNGSIDFEPGLADAVLAQIRRKQDDDTSPNGAGPQAPETEHREEFVAPFLQLVMEKLWKRTFEEKKGRLSVETLEELHGTEQILRDHLVDALAGMSSQDRDIAIDMLGELVTKSRSKIALDIGDLAWKTENKYAPERMSTVLKDLDQKRILRRVSPPPGKPDTEANRRYELYHDVLADPIIEEVSEHTKDRLDRERSEAEDRARRFRRRAIIAGVAAACAGVAAAGALVASLLAFSEKHKAQSRQIGARAERVIDSDPELATLLSLRALKVRHTEEAETALRAALPRLQVRKTLHISSPAKSGAFSSDGNLIATATADGIAHLWDAESHEEVGTLGVASLSALERVAFSPDGKRLVTAYYDGTARIWDVKKHDPVGAPFNEPAGDALNSAAFSPDGKQIVTAGRGGVTRVWDIAHHRSAGEMTDPSGDELTGAEFSPDGKLIVTSSVNRISWKSRARLWDAHSFARLPVLARSDYPINSTAFSPDGKRVVIATGNGVAEIWDVRTRKLLRKLDASEDSFNIMETAAFSPDGKRIVTASFDGKTRIWDAIGAAGAPITDKTPLKILRGPKGMSALSATFNDDGDRVLTTGADGAGRVWDAHEKKQVAVLNPASTDLVNSTTLSPDGKQIVTGSFNGTVTAWDIATGKPRFQVSVPGDVAIMRLGFSPGGQSILAAGDDGNAYFFDASDGSFSVELPTPEDSLVSAGFSQGSSRLFTAGASGDHGIVRIWNSKLDQVGQITAGYINDGSFSPDGSMMVTAGNDGKARVWNAEAKGAERILPPLGQGAPLNSAAFSDDNKMIVTASNDGTAQVWDLRLPNRPRATLKEPNGDGLLSAAFNPGGTEIVISSRTGTARIWDITSRRQVLSLTGHTGAIASVAFSRDGKSLVTASRDGSVRLWETSPAEQEGDVIRGPRNQNVVTASFSPDGRSVGTAGDDGTARMWNAASAEHRLLGHFSVHKALSSLEFSHDGKLIVVAETPGTASIFDARSRRLIGRLRDPQQGAYGGLSSAEFSPDGKLVVTAGYHGARLWNARDGRSAGRLCFPRNQCGQNALRWGSFSADGKRVVTADNYGVARIWDVRSHQQVGAAITEPGGEAMSGARFSPTGDLVVTSSDDGTARVWDWRSGKLIRTFSEPGRSAIYNAVFNPNRDLHTVLTASQDGTARIWSLDSGLELTSFDVGNTVSDAEFSAKGDRVVAAASNGVTRIFSTRLAGSLSRLEKIARHRVTRKLTPEEIKKYG